MGENLIGRGVRKINEFVVQKGRHLVFDIMFEKNGGLETIKKIGLNTSTQRIEYKVPGSDEWHPILGGGGSTGQIYIGFDRRHREIITNKREVMINIPYFEESDYSLLAFQNSAYINEGEDYTTDRVKIYRVGGKPDWIRTTQFEFVPSRHIAHGRKNIGATEKREINVTIPSFTFDQNTHAILVFQNSVLLSEDIDYDIIDNKVVRKDHLGDWSQDTYFDFVVFEKDDVKRNKKIIGPASASNVDLELEGFNAGDHTLLVFRNSVLQTPGINYTIENGNQIFVSGLDEWEPDTVLEFIAFDKMGINISGEGGSGGGTLPGSGIVQKFTRRVDDIAEGITEVKIPIPVTTGLDHLFLIQNSTVILEDKDYEITEDSEGKYVRKMSGGWGEDTVLDFIVLRNIGGIHTDRFIVEDENDGKHYRIGVEDGILFTEEVS